jgi:hypothetical protein
MIKIPKSAMNKPTHVAARFVVVGFPFTARSTMRKKPTDVQDFSGESAADDRYFAEFL